MLARNSLEDWGTPSLRGSIDTIKSRKVHLRVAEVYGQCFMRSLQASVTVTDRLVLSVSSVTVSHSTHWEHCSGHSYFGYQRFFNHRIVIVVSWSVRLSIL